MKTLKNIKKAFSLVLVIAIALITFTACSNNKNKEAAVITNVESTGISSDLETKDDEIIADEVSKEETKEEIKEDSKEETKEEVKEETSDKKEESSDKKDEETTKSEFPITIGIYKFKKQSLSFEDIYFEDEAKVLEYFQTRDINGLYGVVSDLGFNDFAKSITFHIENEKTFNKLVFISKNESSNDALLYGKMYEKLIDSFFYCETDILYEVKDGKIIDIENCPKFIITENSVSILYPFSYVDAETNETIYTPLYIKADLILYNSVENISIESMSNPYQYVKNSATIESKNGFLNKDNALKILAEKLYISETEILFTLENFKLLFDNFNELYIINTQNNSILTKSITNNSYLIYNSIQLDVVNEYYDFELDTTILNISIQIDENTVLKCNFSK